MGLAALVAGVVFLATTGLAQSQTHAAAKYVKPTGTVATVGPLFAAGLTGDHTCTASVVDSDGGNIILTAAHCIAGTGAGTIFAPGYANGVTPYGTWVVQRAYVDPAWTASQDPDADYAFLVVSPSKSNRSDASVQSVVGGNRLDVAPPVGQQVTVAGYVSGSDDLPVICSTSVYLTQAYPTFDCAGYAGGTSGSPWIVDLDPTTGSGTITALIGGLNQGGCVPQTSYSSSFSNATLALLTRAITSNDGDDLPTAGTDGCAPDAD